MTKFKTVWFWDSGRSATESQNYIMSFFDDSHEKPSIVRNEKSPHHSYCHSFNSIDDAGRCVVHLVSDDFIGSADIWYVYIDAVESVPPSRMVMAFADGKYPNGTVLTFRDAVDESVNPQDHVGFIRWFVGDSRIQQIFVSEDHRRKRISTKLFSVADLLIVADKNWNSIFLNGGDITTDDGELLRSAWSKSTRVTPRTGSVTHSVRSQ